MINTVIFDIGNVLAAYDWQTSLKSYGFSAEKYEILADAVYRHTCLLYTSDAADEL